MEAVGSTVAGAPGTETLFGGEPEARGVATHWPRLHPCAGPASLPVLPGLPGAARPLSRPSLLSISPGHELAVKCPLSDCEFRAHRPGSTAKCWCLGPTRVLLGQKPRGQCSGLQQPSGGVRSTRTESTASLLLPRAGPQHRGAEAGLGCKGPSVEVGQQAEWTVGGGSLGREGG